MVEEPKIESGKTLLSLMDKQGLNPTVFIWIIVPGSDIWRLLISSKAYDRDKNIKQNYKNFIAQFGEEPSVKDISLSNISILPYDDAFLKLLRVMIKTPRNSVLDIRFKSNVINGIFVKDAYIYRLT